MAAVNWVALESNPANMNVFMENVGVPAKWKVCDVYGLEEEMLAMVPKPALAVVFLFPESVEVNKPESSDVPEGVYFMKQLVGNACGTIALMHAIANNEDSLGIAPDSIIGKFLDATKGLSPEERGEKLKNSSELCDVHAKASAEGQTTAPNADDKIEHHFVALAEKGGVLYEFSGCQSAPVNHGPSSPESFLKDVAVVCKKYMEKDPENVNFNVMVLAAAE